MQLQRGSRLRIFVVVLLGSPLTYVPQPLDTAQVQLPEEVKQLTELLAKNTHEGWSAQRIADGWRYGPQRDDVAKTHPCLVPYEELSESEKDYDRLTSLNTLKTILALGYKLTR